MDNSHTHQLFSMICNICSGSHTQRKGKPEQVSFELRGYVLSVMFYNNNLLYMCTTGLIVRL